MAEEQAKQETSMKHAGSKMLVDYRLYLRRKSTDL
jgi:hypothetical protein